MIIFYRYTPFRVITKLRLYFPVLYNISFLFIYILNGFLIHLLFNWKIIAVQNFVGFCQISTWISHRYSYAPSLLNHLPISLPIPPLLVVQSSSLSSLSYTTNSHWLSIFQVVMKFPCYSLHTSYPLLPPMSISLISMSVSPLLPCKWFYHSHLSKFHIYVLVYDISFSDLLHSV